MEKHDRTRVFDELLSDSKPKRRGRPRKEKSVVSNPISKVKPVNTTLADLELEVRNLTKEILTAEYGSEEYQELIARKNDVEGLINSSLKMAIHQSDIEERAIRERDSLTRERDSLTRAHELKIKEVHEVTDAYRLARKDGENANPFLAAIVGILNGSFTNQPEVKAISSSETISDNIKIGVKVREDY